MLLRIIKKLLHECSGNILKDLFLSTPFLFEQCPQEIWFFLGGVHLHISITDMQKCIMLTIFKILLLCQKMCCIYLLIVDIRGWADSSLPQWNEFFWFIFGFIFKCIFKTLKRKTDAYYDKSVNKALNIH